MEVDDKIVGTYWMVLNKHGKGRIICQGKEPILNKEHNSWRCDPEGGQMGWLFIDQDQEDYAMKNGRGMCNKDFKDLKFPKITLDDPPMQIEITKSGKVYQIVEI